MVHKIFICAKVPDARANLFINKLHEMGFGTDKVNAQIINVYSVKKNLNRNQVKICAEMLSNPVVQEYYLDKINGNSNFDWAIEIGFLPGVTDNIAYTATEMISDGLHVIFSKSDHIYTSRIYFLTNKFSRSDIQKIADSLYNPIIERATIANRASFPKLIQNPENIPEVKLRYKQTVDTVNLNVSDEGLTIIGKSGIANSDGTRRGPLALSLPFMKVIQKYFTGLKRNPTDIELESIAQTWSEHCKHTIFADPIDDIKGGLFKTYIRNATIKIRKKLGKKDFCVSVFSDNSGAIEFDNTCLVTHKVETHNSPSALDPFGGSITGIVGVNRDAIGFGMGAKPIVNTYGFCFSDPKDTELLYRGKDKTQPMLAPRRILDGVVAGVNSGGNCSGIPTPQGFVCFDSGYKGKPLVFVGTVGLIPKKVNGISMIRKKANPDDLIVMVGGRVGLDGIHGATFSSEALASGSPATAVQIGDPITQKKLSDVLVKEARDQRLFTSITDNGAGGLSCSVAEMAKESNGFLVNLEKVPLKYTGLSPWQIWISESQERMTLSVPVKKWKKLQNLLTSRGVEATVIGKFTETGKCIVTFKGKTVMNVGIQFLHNGLPRQQLQSIYTKPVHMEPKLPDDKDLTATLRKMMCRLNIAGYGFISGQYDHEVQGSSVLKPLVGRGRVNADTSVIRPALSSMKGIVLGQSLYPWYGDIDMYQMAACSIDNAIRNVVVTGANLNKIALLDNFCWCSSKDPERLGQLKAAAKACYDTAIMYRTPFISGKDSMFNDFFGFDKNGKNIKISIRPTLLISAIGIIEDVKKAVSLDFKAVGDLIYLIGNTFDELGASEYFTYLGDVSGNYISGNKVPAVNAKQNLETYKTISKCIDRQIIASALGVGRGGLAVALAKSTIGGRLGIDVSVQHLPGKVSRNDSALFSESQGRILVSINSEYRTAFEKSMENIPHICLGKILGKNGFVIKGLSGKTVVSTDVVNLNKQYTSTFENY